MIKLYTTSDCLGCRHAKKFFEENNIDFTEKNFTRHRLTEEELKDILSLTNNGFEDVISMRSKEFAKLGAKTEDLKFSEIVDLIIKNPTILRRPITIQYNNNGKPYRLLVGFNTNDIQIFTRSSDEQSSIYRSCNCSFNTQCREHYCINNKQCSN